MTRTEYKRLEEQEAEDAVARQSSACSEDERPRIVGLRPSSAQIVLPDVQAGDWVMPG